MYTTRRKGRRRRNRLDLDRETRNWTQGSDSRQSQTLLEESHPSKQSLTDLPPLNGLTSDLGQSSRLRTLSIRLIPYYSHCRHESLPNLLHAPVNIVPLRSTETDRFAFSLTNRLKRTGARLSRRHQSSRRVPSSSTTLVMNPPFTDNVSAPGNEQ